MRDVARYAFIVLATLAGLVLLWKFHLALVLFLLSVVAASALRPAIAGLVSRGASRRAAMALVYGALFLAIAGLSILLARPVAGDLQEFADDIVIGYDRIKMEWPRGGTQLQRTLAGWLPPSEDFYSAVSSEDGLSSMAGVVGAAQGVLTFLARTAIVLVLSMYWSVDRRRFERLSLSLLPQGQHERVRGALDAVETGTGAYVRTELAQSLIVGLILGACFWLVGIPYPALLAPWVAIMRLIPWFGPILAVLPSVLAIVAGAVIPGIAAGILSLAVLFIFRLAIGPRSNGKFGGGLWHLLATISMGELWGLGGAMIAPVIVVAIRALAEHMVWAPARRPELPVSDRPERIGGRLTDPSGGA